MIDPIKKLCFLSLNVSVNEDLKEINQEKRDGIVWPAERQPHLSQSCVLFAAFQVQWSSILELFFLLSYNLCSITVSLITFKSFFLSSCCFKTPVTYCTVILSYETTITVNKTVQHACVFIRSDLCYLHAEAVVISLQPVQSRRVGLVDAGDGGGGLGVFLLLVLGEL